MATTIMPSFYDETLPDAVIEVNTEEAYAMARRLVREEGIFAGISSAANVLGALKLARTLSASTQLPSIYTPLIVTVLADGGARYLRDSFWDAEGVETL
jgi:cysteine synthase B